MENENDNNLVWIYGHINSDTLKLVTDKVYNYLGISKENKKITKEEILMFLTVYFIVNSENKNDTDFNIKINIIKQLFKKLQNLYAHKKINGKIN